MVSGAGAGALAGCLGTGNVDAYGVSEPTPRSPPTGSADVGVALTAAPGEIQPDPDVTTENWLYNGEFPGPELRASEGDVIEVELSSDLPDGTTIHWHGVPVANEMDGVPNVTQDPVETGRSFTYQFRVAPAGTFFFHSHVRLQLDRDLLAPLIVEETDPHVDYDRE